MAGRTVSLFLVARDRMSKTFAKAAEHSDKFADRVDKLNGVTRKVSGLAAMAGGLSAVGAAAAPAAAAVAAMPAAMLAAKVATATLKVGLVGVSDAMGAMASGDAKQLNEALKDLSPSARAFVREAGGLKKAFEPVQKAVQERLFSGLAAQMGVAGRSALPTVRQGMLGVAGALNGVAKEAVKVAGTSVFRGQLSKIFAGTTGVVKTLTGAVRPLTMTVLRLGVISLPLAQRMAEWGKNGIKAAAGFVKSEKGASFLKGAVKSAGDTLATLGRIAGNIGKILIGVFKNAGSNGTGLLSTLEQLTATAAAWVKSAQGQEKIANVFGLLRQVMASIVQILPFVVGPIGALASLLTSLPPSVQGVAAKVIIFGTAAGFLATKIFGVVGVLKTVGPVAKKMFAGINAAMKGGPIGIVLTLLGLLVAGLVLAYTKSETFRSIVQNAWAAIQSAVATAWNGYIKPALTALRNFIVNEVIPRVLFLWNNVFRPVFSDIGKMVSSVWTSTVKPALAALWSFISNQVGPAVLWLWRNVIAPAFRTIGSIISAVWSDVVKPTLQALWAFISKILVPVIMFLWRNVVAPAFRTIGAIISAVWKGVIRPVLQALWSFLVNTVAPKIKWFYANVVKPTWNLVGGAIKTVWNGIIKPAFAALRTGVNKVGDAFKGASNFIKTAWDKIKAAVKAPIKFVVETVLNNGILKAWNFVAEKFNLSPKNLSIPLPKGFATGGHITGPGGSKSDRVPIMASNGEFMVNAAATRRYRPLLEAINKQGGAGFRVAKALGVTGDPGGLGLPGFAEGGIIGGLKAFFGKAKDWFMDGVKNAARLVTEPILRSLESAMGGSPFGRMLAGVPRSMVNGFLSWIGGKENAISAGGGGAGGKAVAAARSQLGVPYSWGGGGPGGPSYGIEQGAHIRGFDCSGLTEYAWYKATGKSIGGTTYSQKGILKRVGVPRPGDVGQPHPGHTYLMSGPGKIIEAPYTGSHVREVGMRSTGWWGRPPWVMDTGGVLGPGLNPPIYNGTGGPEYVLRPDQLAAAREVWVRFEVTGADSEMKRMIRKMVRVDGRGNVQVAFGTRNT